jgi:predicted dehydrogenase
MILAPRPPFDNEVADRAGWSSAAPLVGIRSHRPFLPASAFPLGPPVVPRHGRTPTPLPAADVIPSFPKRRVAHSFRTVRDELVFPVAQLPLLRAPRSGRRAVLAIEQYPVMKPLRVAITGCHRMHDRAPAGHNWAAAFASVHETSVVAVHDRGEETRQRFADLWNVPAYEDFERMLTRERPEIVCVATRQTLHAEQVEAAVAHGARGILCEKPLATSMAEADRIASACRRGRTCFALGLDRRWMSFYRHVRALIDAGIVGDVRTVASFGVPNLIHTGCHWFDMLAFLAGDPAAEWVAGTLETPRGNPADPPGSGVIAFAGGARALVDCGAGGVGFDVIGTTGRMTLLNDGAVTALWTREVSGPLALREMPAPPPVRDPRIEVVRDLVGAIREDRVTACDLDPAMRSLEIGLGFHASHALAGARVALPLADRLLQVPSLPWGNE